MSDGCQLLIDSKNLSSLFPDYLEEAEWHAISAHSVLNGDREARDVVGGCSSNRGLIKPKSLAENLGSGNLTCGVLSHTDPQECDSRVGVPKVCNLANVY